MKNKPKTISLNAVSSALEEIKKHEDLKKLQLENATTFCEKYSILPGQFNFLISVVAAERIKERGIL